ncbi:MAG: TraR/DksA family transcriptional regulator [Desulfuromonadaceae bacterium]|nr:TraR/DksA family transcriptional regulator [Desulfuromonadaceae bacterium]
MEELTEQQLQELHADLSALQKELQNLLVDSRDSSKAVALDQPIGRLSRMDALQQQAMAKANRAAHQQRLRGIEAALQGMKLQRYGECRNCEEPIGYPRLKARPETPFCLVCQGQIEKSDNV